MQAVLRSTDSTELLRNRRAGLTDLSCLGSKQHNHVDGYCTQIAGLRVLNIDVSLYSTLLSGLFRLFRFEEGALIIPLALHGYAHFRGEKIYLRIFFVVCLATRAIE